MPIENAKWRWACSSGEGERDDVARTRNGQARSAHIL